MVDELVTEQNLDAALLAQEIRILKTIGAMFVVAVTILLAGIPILLKFLGCSKQLRISCARAFLI